MQKTLIAEPRRKREFGHDTIQLALGRLSRFHSPVADYDLEIGEGENRKILAALFAITQKTKRDPRFYAVVSSQPQVGRIRWHVRGERISAINVLERAEDSTSLSLSPGQSCTVVLHIETPTSGRVTQMHVVMRQDRRKTYWLNVRANPTSLLLGYNAFAVSIEGRTQAAERRMLLRLPFAALRRIVRAMDPEFTWEESTSLRIRKLAFRIGNAQVFTYLQTPIPSAAYLAFLRNCYSVPFSRGRTSHNVLADDLRLKVQSEGSFGRIETLLIRRMAGFSGLSADRHVLSVNFYDKSLKAASDAGAANVDIGSEEVRSFLKSHVRVDITLHEEALRQLLREAGLSKSDELTAGNFASAITTLNRGQGRSGQRFMRWLLGYALDDVLALRRLLGFSPALLDRAEAELAAYNANAAAGFVQWRKRQFRLVPKGADRQVTFSQFLQRHAKVRVSAEVARKARAKLLAFGLDPDIPLRCYTAFYNQTFFANMTDKQALAYARALEAGNATRIMRLQKESRKAALRTMGLVRRSYEAMLDAAHVPAIEVSPDRPAADKPCRLPHMRLWAR